MESNKIKVPEKIISDLFGNDKMKKGSKESLENDINRKMENSNNQETLKLILESYKADLFDLNPEYKNNIIHGEINPISSMLDIIQKYDPKPELYFILLKPLFNLYQTNLEPKQIKTLTERITNCLDNKPKIILSNFNDLFEILILTKISQDQDVKNSGINLDKLLKKSLQEYSDNIKIYKDYFDFDSFCNKINEKLSSQQYVIISLLVNWIGTICQIREVAIVKFFQENILPWIFKLQMGIARDVSKNSDKCFKIIKSNIDENFTIYYKYDKKSMEEILSVIINEASSKSNKISIPAWELLNLFLIKSEKHLDLYLKKDKKNPTNKNSLSSISLENNLNDNEIKESATFKGGKSKSTMSLPGNFENKDNKINITKNINIIPGNYSSNKTNIINDNDKKNSNKKIFKTTIVKSPGGPSFEFKNLSNKQTYINELTDDNLFTDEDDILEYIPFDLFHKILISITETYSQEIENTELINGLNESLKRIIEKSPNEIINYGFVPIDMTNVILIGLKNPVNKNKGKFLEWCNILYRKYNKEMFKDFSIFIKEFIQAMPSNESETFMNMVKFLSNIKMERDITNITMKYLTEKLMKEPELMNNMIIILEHLTKNSSLAVIYESLADVLKDIKNFPFVSKLIDYLNQFLMRNPLGVSFRKSLINNEGKEKYNELFVKMYNIWSINSISLLIFCVITEHFELAYNIILNLVKVQLDNDYYIHLGTLVQLLESELYDYIRIRLLEPTNNIYLVRTLYGILMLLPQGQAFNVLSNRMSNVQTLFEIENGFNNIKVEEDNNEEIDKFIEIFLNNQKIKREDEENRNKNKLNL